jgi:hypothetical protein
LGLPSAFYLFLGACVFHKYLSSTEEIVLQEKENENARHRNENAASAGKKCHEQFQARRKTAAKSQMCQARLFFFFFLFRLSCRSYFRCIIKKLCIT